MLWTFQAVLSAPQSSAGLVNDGAHEPSAEEGIRPVSPSESDSAPPRDVLAWLEGQARDWILAQRALYRPRAAETPAAARELLGSFFDQDVLDRARWCLVPQIDEPPFQAEALARGMPRKIDFGQMAGITFQDTVLISQAHLVGDDIPTALLLHELAHVVQYDLLGVEEFARQYVRGYAAADFDYFAIPLERVAFECQGRFEAAPQAVFSVRDEVTRHLEAGA
jgi:hypothetical protein